MQCPNKGSCANFCVCVREWLYGSEKRRCFHTASGCGQCFHCFSVNMMAASHEGSWNLRCLAFSLFPPRRVAVPVTRRWEGASELMVVEVFQLATTARCVAMATTETTMRDMIKEQNLQLCTYFTYFVFLSIFSILSWNQLYSAVARSHCRDTTLKSIRLWLHRQYYLVGSLLGCVFSLELFSRHQPYL